MSKVLEIDCIDCSVISGLPGIHQYELVIPQTHQDQCLYTLPDGGDWGVVPHARLGIFIYCKMKQKHPPNL